MKKLITLVFAAFSTPAFSQNQQINPTDNSQVYPQQAAVYNNNKGNINAQQTNFNANANTDQLAQVSQQQASDQGGIYIKTRSAGPSGFSSKTTKSKMHTASKHTSSKFFDKLFDKRYKAVPHYKRKSRFKKCSFF
jgi:hypothetical protein